MTTIVGICQNGKVYMGCDSCMSSGNLQIASDTPKIIQRSNILIGVAGNTNALRHLKHSLDIADLSQDNASNLASVTSYIEGRFIPSMKLACLNEPPKPKRWWQKKDKKEDTVQNTFMIGMSGLLYTIGSDFSSMSCPDYYAIGSGSDVAMGSLFATRAYVFGVGTVMSPKERIEMALRAAAWHTKGTSEPFRFFEI